jgi:hypothetical protein
MTGRDQRGNKRAAHGAGSACNKNSHGEILIFVATAGAANPAGYEFKRANAAHGRHCSGCEQVSPCGRAKDLERNKKGAPLRALSEMMFDPVFAP